MSLKKDKQREERRFQLKRNLLNGIVVTAVIIFTILLLMIMIIYFMTSNRDGEVSYPASPLTKMLNQPYSYIKDDALDIQLQFPSVPVVLNVGGTERYVSDEGCVFRYNNNLSISVYEIEGSAYDILSTIYGENLYNGEISGEVTYVPEVITQDVGYFNSFPAEYQCGVLQISDENNVVYRYIYVVTMVIDIGVDKNVMISISTSEAEKLYEAELLLESIGYTVMDTSITQEVIAEEIETNSESDMNVSVKVEQELGEDNNLIGSEDYGDGFEYINIEIPLLRHYENGAVIVLQYTNVDADIRRLLIQNKDSSDSEKIYPSSNSGLGFFALWEGKKGNYTIKVPIDIELGTYSARVLDYEDFLAEYGDILPKP